jgi:hypothetical protein
MQVRRHSSNRNDAGWTATGGTGEPVAPSPAPVPARSGEPGLTTPEPVLPGPAPVRPDRLGRWQAAGSG